MNSIFINDVVNSQIDSLASTSMVQTDLSRILMIYTGGTIGMENNCNHVYHPVQGYLTLKLTQNDRFHQQEMRENVVFKSTKVNPTTTVNGIPCKQLSLPALTTPASLFNKKIQYSILEYDPLLDSSNMTMSDWVQIATDIEINYELYDAFLILHGTDTMAYTASALSFMLENLGKSVIITGSQVPLSEIRTDALDNLLGALTIAGHFVIPEVGLFFDNKLFRGNRCSKVNAMDFNAFESPNLLPLVTVGINIDVSWEDVWRPKRIARFKAHKNLNASVATLRLFPGITEATVSAFFAPPMAGVVLETYGSGNALSNRPDILAIIKNACDRGVVVVNCSQCKKATVTSLYQTGLVLLQVGVIPGADMTPECALTKLTYLLGKYNDPAKVRHFMCKNVRGELTLVSKKTQFTYLPFGNTQNAMVSSIMQVIGMNPNVPVSTQSAVYPDIPDDTNDLDDHCEDGGVASRLVPIAFCHASRIGDIPTLSFLVQHFEHMIDLPSEEGMVFGN
jgi:60kDa lysophospholipase